MRPSRYIELEADALQIGLDGALADVQPLGGLMVGVAGGDVGEDLNLAGERLDTAPGLRCATGMVLRSAVM